MVDDQNSLQVARHGTNGLQGGLSADVQVSKLVVFWFVLFSLNFIFVCGLFGLIHNWNARNVYIYIIDRLCPRVIVRLVADV
jgi:hypothetical protein